MVDFMSMARAVPTYDVPDRVIEYGGPHIPTLCRLLEEGYCD